MGLPPGGEVFAVGCSRLAPSPGAWAPHAAGERKRPAAGANERGVQGGPPCIQLPLRGRRQGDAGQHTERRDKADEKAFYVGWERAANIRPFCVNYVPSRRPRRAWTCRTSVSRGSSPTCSWPRAASTLPPAPAAAPSRSTVVQYWLLCPPAVYTSWWRDSLLPSRASPRAHVSPRLVATVHYICQCGSPLLLFSSRPARLASRVGPPSVPDRKPPFARFRSPRLLAHALGPREKLRASIKKTTWGGPLQFEDKFGDKFGDRAERAGTREAEHRRNRRDAVCGTPHTSLQNTGTRSAQAPFLSDTQGYRLTEAGTSRVHASATPRVQGCPTCAVPPASKLSIDRTPPPPVTIGRGI